MSSDNLRDPKWLAAAIASYEADEPHVDLPDCKADSPNYYPPIDPDLWERYRYEEHMGDCVGEPCACVRCAAEMTRDKAEWIIQKSKEQ